MEDSDVLALENASTNRVRKAELAKEHRDRLMAIKGIDKPNIHRLVELVHCTLPMIGHVSNIGELVMEKAHQTLKRAIQQSNKKDVQVQSVQSSAFNDWQGRLTVQVQGALSGNPNSVRGCFRLLAGRDAAQSLSANVMPRITDAVRNALGPDCCIPALLASQRKSVLSPRGSCSGPKKWSLEKNIEHMTTQSNLSAQERNDSYRAFSSLCRLLRAPPSLVFGNVMRLRYRDGLTDCIITCGDIVAVRCTETPSNSQCSPAIVQTSSRQAVPNNSENIRLLFWGVIALFTRQKDDGNHEFWAAVYPCNALSDIPVTDGNVPNRQMYTLNQRISFLELEPTIHVVAKIPVCGENTCTPSTNKMPHHALRKLQYLQRYTFLYTF